VKRVVAACAFALVAACIGTTIDAKNYDQSCDADVDCVVIQTGDICSCNCALGAINDVDFDKYTNDVIRIGACLHSCVPDDPDAAPYVCGGGTGARCNAGTCATYALPADAGAE
jgi:hypothetical protein